MNWQTAANIEDWETVGSLQADHKHDGPVSRKKGAIFVPLVRHLVLSQQRTSC